ncbi:uncharacterized protein LOC105685695 [Athalia rosae]|uniref:uncharacterized protein LOC105685695 n=1 Tax=Athalia rosae TaxID=37344 RepID=UPI00203448A0|nr:uncharacterized protein LOC105685695 [Athalia rosae]
MGSYRELILLSLYVLLTFIGCSADEDRHIWSDRPDGVLGSFTSHCLSEDPKNASVSCQGVRIVRRVVRQFLDKSSGIPNIELSDGVKLVESSSPGTPRRARNMRNLGVVGQVVNFLEGRELRVKLPSILPDNLETALKESLPSAGQARKEGGGFGGGGGGGKKGGGGGVMMMALMMGKMMGALGLGALGLLAMKALMVSGLALMLSLIVAAKKLAGGHDEGGGHHVIYAQEGHGHGHKRSLDYLQLTELPYRGYADDYAIQNS